MKFVSLSADISVTCDVEAMRIVNKHVAEMEAAGIIRKSNSQFAVDFAGCPRRQESWSLMSRYNYNATMGASSPES